MGKRIVFLVLALGFCLSPAAHATNIIWVCESIDITADGTPDDAAWIPWLQGLGYTVDVQRGNWTTLDNAKIAALNAADLIIISRTTSSGNYNNDATEISQWSGITAPIINLTSYLVRNSRWFWVNTATINNLVGPMMEVVVPDHPIFTGIKLNAANQVAVVDGTTGTGQTSFIGMTDVGSGTLLAKTGTNAWIVEWQPGKPFYTGSSETPAGKRLLFNAGTQETAPQPQGAFNLTEDGKKMLNNAILYMIGKSIVEGQATDPQPEPGQTDVPSDVVLSWTAGEFAQTHDVYLGLSSTDVGDASRTAPLGLLAGQDQSNSSFAPTGLEFGQTYYWRVDEVDASASAIVKGEVWSFTVEPLAYAINTVTATASSAQANMGPENTVNGSGLSANDQHSTDASQMWMSAGAQPNWIQYQFDQVYKLTEMWVWNSNQMIETFVGFGAKDVTIEYSEDGVAWTTLAGVPVFAQATGAASYTYNTTVDFGGALAQYVKLTLNASWGGLAQTGLAEVRFFQIPVQAREPQPASGATGVDLNVTLNWRQGREAASHQVYFSSDQNAVTDGTAAAVTVTDHSYSPASLQFGTTYYWKVDEIGAAATPGTQAGAVWNFTSQEYAAIDDFESYNDDDNRIYDTWLDGLVNNNGSIVGYFQAPFAEQTIVHGGKQSMPVEYNNVKAPYYSEAEQDFSSAQNWTDNGVDSLVVYFQGRALSFLDKGASSYLMGGSGTDIWNSADQFRFAFQSLSGNGTIIAKVESVGNTDPWAKGGVMIRESLDPGARFAAVYATPGNGVRYQARLLAASAATSDTAVATPEQIALKTPVWIKLDRSGNNFSCSYSTDGVKWTALSWNPQSITMTGTVYLGLAVTSHNAAAATTVEFSNVATTGGVTGAWQVQAIGVAQPSNDPAPLYVVVQDSAGKSKVVTHPDPLATTATAWQQWRIPLSEFTSAGVKMTAVKKLIIGVGDRASPKAGGAGLLYIDDIGYGHPASAQ
ncbi:MAG: discoidin domain-containing protein [Phycisphaerae bacterium]|nr:discoidin domain-containing protein [Phycisphaerae bacterium]